MPEVASQLYKQITVTGKDAVQFLQGQLTQDINLLTKTGQLPAAWCNPKGRVVATLRLIKVNASIGLLVPSNLHDALLKRLQMYRLRSDVEFVTNCDDWKELVEPNDVDPKKLILAGIPTIDASNSEKFTPHMLNLDKLGAISFTKGCYTGQEVVARTENLGKSKRRLMRYRAADCALSVGATLTLADKNVGEVVNVFGQDLLAVTPIEVHGEALTCGTLKVTPTGLPYLIQGS